MQLSSLHDIVLNARTNHNKTFRHLVWGLNVSGKEEKLKEIIYDVRQDSDFDYVSASEQNGILERKIFGYTGREYRKSLGSDFFFYAPYIPTEYLTWRRDFTNAIRIEIDKEILNELIRHRDTESITTGIERCRF